MRMTIVLSNIKLMTFGILAQFEMFSLITYLASWLIVHQLISTHVAVEVARLVLSLCLLEPERLRSNSVRGLLDC